MKNCFFTLFVLSISMMLSSCSTESTPVYQLSTAVEPTEAGTVSQDATEAEEGESITITATANEHWLFNGWQGDLAGSQNPASVLMDRDKRITALFIKRDYPLSINIEGSGEVQEEIAPARTTEYQHGTFVQLTAQPDDGWIFFEWGGDMSEDENPKIIEIDGGKQVNVVFKSIDELLTTDVVGGGSLQINQQSFEDNPSRRQLTITATPDENWEFGSWSGDANSNEAELVVELAGPVAITATFNRKEFTLLTETDGSGSVETELVSGTQTDDGYLFESVVKLTAVAETGWRFTGWDGDLTGTTTPVELMMDSDKRVKALFDNPELTISIETEGNGSATVAPQKETYRIGDQVVFTAAPASGHEFMGWSGSFGGRSRSVSKVMEEDLSVKASFSAIEDALVYSFSGGTFINDRIFGASLTLINRLPEAIVLRKFALLNANGVELTSAEDNESVGPGRQIGYSISFGIAPTQQQFSQYIAAWHVTYKGNNYLKQTRVGFIGTSASEIIDGDDHEVRTLFIEE